MTSKTPDQKIINDAKTAWNRLTQAEKNEYVDIAKQETKARGNKLIKIAFSYFVSDFYEHQRLSKYRKGPEGIISWVEDNVKFKVPLHDSDGILINKWLYVHEFPPDVDKYGRSCKSFWENHKQIIREAMRMEYGEYVYKLIVLCWPRGEAKSFLIRMIFLHRFFCYPYQRIFLTSSSRELSDEMHFKDAKETIQNSPKLHEIVGESNILADEIRLTRGYKGIFNAIRLLSTSSGLASNATMIIQTEAFEAETDSHFVKWYGSLRATPNAMGLIDTTVSHKGHWLHNLYKKSQKPGGRTFFSYRYSEHALPGDYWNPRMDDAEIKDYQDALTPYDFARYFQNIWDTTALKIFSPFDIAAIQYIGIDGIPGNHPQIIEVLKKNEQLMRGEKKLGKKFDGYEADFWERGSQIEQNTMARLTDIHEIYDFGKHAPPENQIRTGSRWATLSDLETLGDFFGTYFAILVGLDMSNALKTGNRMTARTMLTWTAKGLPGSKDKSEAELSNADQVYIYFLMGIASIEDHQPPTVSHLIQKIFNEFGRIEMVAADTYGSSTQKHICENLGIPFMAEHPSLEKQNIGFNELITAINSGRFKSPIVPVHGSKHPDILREEIEIFDLVKKSGGKPKYGSSEKHQKGGIQDDVMDCLGTSLYAGLKVTAVNFKPRKKKHFDFTGCVHPGMTLISDIYGGL